MTDSMKFGPEWLRNMKSSDSTVSGGGGNMVSSAPATIKMAEFRYGREEMLALYNRTTPPPDSLKQMQGLFTEKTQTPLALLQMTDEETRMWNRGINSEQALRKPGVGVVPAPRGAMAGRGGSVDRGRGRGRGGTYHYNRGLSYEDTEPINGYNNRNLRNYDRSQSQGNWAERNGGDPGEYIATSPRKEFGGRGLSETNWRRHRGGGEEDDGWRSSRSEKWGRGTSSWREGDNSNWDRNRPWEEGTNSSHPPPRKPWDSDENNLPEWATENPGESGGSFDASGAFHGGTVFSDDEEGPTNSNSDQRRTEPKSSSQPRPAPPGNREPPNVSNGTSTLSVTGNNESQKHSSSGTGPNLPPLRQSHSATNLTSERRPTNPITSSASLSGVNSHTSHSTPESKLKREEVNKSLESRLQTSNKQLNKTVEAPTASVAVEKKEVDKTTQEDEIDKRIIDATNVFVSQLVDEEEKEPPAATTKASPPTTTPPQTETLWYYQDPQGSLQGPFPSSEMSEWYNSRYFASSLLVRRALDERFSPLSDFIKINKDSPFLMNYYLVPPIKNTPETLLPPPVLEDPMILQLQIQQQQRLMLQRQAALAKLTSDFSSLSIEQQQMLAHQAQLEMSLHANMLVQQGQQMPTPSSNNVQAMFHHHLKSQQLQQQHQQPRAGAQLPVAPDSTLGPIQQLLQQIKLQVPSRPTTTPQNTPEEQLGSTIEQFMNVFRQRQVNTQQAQPQPVTMESVWGGATAVPSFPSWSGPLGHPVQPQALWSEPVTKGIKTEQEILEEQFLKSAEEKTKELRKQEELLRLQEEEERRLRQLKEEEEELERKRKEEEQERKRLQEVEKKKKEAAAAKKAEQDRLRKEEEKRKKDEEKKRKEEEKRKQEEERKKDEEEKKRLEEERKKREEMTKRQNEALKLLQEQQQQARAVKATPVAPWTAPETPGASLADIQKTERKQQQQLREQQEMLKAFQEKHQLEQQQQLKNSKSGSNLNLKWAESTKMQPTRVKSLAEIQAEEQEQTAKLAEKEKAERMAASKEVPIAATGSIWASANQTLSWNNSQQPPSVWGNTSVASSVSGSGARFFDEVNVKPTKPSKPSVQQPVAKSQAKTKAKKEEASVMKLFENKLPKNSKLDEFNLWCIKTLTGFASDVDAPTFVDFLSNFESHNTVREYVKIYLGETREANDFASEFINRRTRLLSADMSQGNHHRQEPLPDPSNQSNNFQEVKGKNKKVKKSKMTKVDSRILGFNVTAAPDRINVGDRDYGEGL